MGRMDTHQPRGSVAEARRAAVGREGLGPGSVLSPELVARGECRWASCPHCRAHHSQAAIVRGVELNPPDLLLPVSSLQRGSRGRTPIQGGSCEARGVNVQPIARPCQEHDKARRAGLRRAAPSGLRSAREGPHLPSEGSSSHSLSQHRRGNAGAKEGRGEGPADTGTFKAFLLGTQGKQTVGGAEAGGRATPVQGTPHHTPRSLNWPHSAGEDGVARRPKSTQKFTLPLPLCAVTAQVRLFIKELHFPDSPASGTAR